MKKNLLTGFFAIVMMAGPLYVEAEATSAAGSDLEPGIAASGDNTPGEWRKRGERHFSRFAEALQLSPEQQNRIEAIRTETREKTAPLRQRMKDLKQKMRLVSLDETFDENAVRTLAAEQSEIRTELLVEKARMRSQIHALLTPEQRAKAEEFNRMRGPGRKGKRSLR